MEEKRDGAQEEQQVIQEQIIPQKKKNGKKFGKSLLRLAVSAVVFGLFAGFALVLSGKFFIKKFGLESTLRQMVGIGTVTQAASPTATPALTRPVTPTKSPTETDGQETPDL